MRDYENHRISAAAWTGIALTISFAFFPIEISLPVILGMGWVDLIMGIMRARKSNYYPAVPIVLYLVLMIVPLSYFFGLTPLVIIGASIVATFLGIMSEMKKNLYIDDDFLMIIVPLFGLYLIFVTAGLI